jgi:hypothetical protein
LLAKSAKKTTNTTLLWNATLKNITKFATIASVTCLKFNVSLKTNKQPAEFNKKMFFFDNVGENAFWNSVFIEFYG